MHILDATTKSLEVVTTTTSAIDYNANFMDHTTSGGTGASSEGQITTATTTTVVTAPAASTQRQVKQMSLRNVGTGVNAVTVQKDVSGVKRALFKATLYPGESLLYIESAGFLVFDVAGRLKQTTQASEGLSGIPVSFMKVGTAAEAAGVTYCFAKDAGLPGAWSPGAPGINGRATDGASAGDSGCITFPDPPAGNPSLTGLTATAGVAGSLALIDILWVNTGISVTTLTAQAIAAVTAAARDSAGTSNGEQVLMGLLVTAATTNAGAVTNITATYTDSDGNTGNTATMPSFPATAVVGTLVPFSLAAGDRGVRVPESITIGTSLVTGSVSLILYRVIQAVGTPTAAIGNTARMDPNTGVRVYPRLTGAMVSVPSAVTAQTIQGVITFASR
jgi:hypothetical protein